ncbi:DUF1150 family protein [Aerophototrophica crusticola]|uniref:DUF1150 family protein n=1 Tax=Aerophototrophica crusticola TaxID=1709002 RepID=A0A858RBF4_9PROT|nr:DUF1150 family protein [Rhodospirillaceae bacterium B3]
MNLTTQFLRQLSAKDFATFGLNDIAYVKRVVADGAEGFAIHAADGTQLAVVPAEDVAVATVRQHDMEPALVQ